MAANGTATLLTEVKETYVVTILQNTTRGLPQSKACPQLLCQMHQAERTIFVWP